MVNRIGMKITKKPITVIRLNQEQHVEECVFVLFGSSIHNILSIMASILRKAANYKRINSVLVEGEAHLRDPLMPPPKILTPPTTTRDPSPDDVTDFPAYKTIPIPESIPYREGKYRPPSIPLITGTSSLT